MTSWRAIITRHFTPGVKRVTAVSDADGLLRDPLLTREIQARGFEIVQYEDPIAFRFDYETRFRARWDAGENPELVVVFQPAEREFETLPADVLAIACEVSFTLKDIFPKLSYNVISKLETIHYDSLFEAQSRYESDAMGELLTKDFVLQHVFRVVPGIVTKDSDLLRLLCAKHYRQAALPPILDEHLISELRQRPAFSEWPIELLVRDRKAFWEFLDERWKVFIEETRGGTARTHEKPRVLKHPGPELLPFHHEDVRVFVDNLFADGILTPVPWNWDDAAPEKWIRVGITGSGTQNTALRFDELIRDLPEKQPGEGSSPQDWLGFAHRYGQARLLWSELDATTRNERQTTFRDFCSKVDAGFQAWLQQGYGSIFNYPVATPLMVHHLPGYVAHLRTANPGRKHAVLVCDGMAIEQWLAAKEELRKQGFTISADESALFAWVPTITPISRQALFSGKVPRYFGDTIGRTDRDEPRWRQFWADRGVPADQVNFISVHGDDSDSAKWEGLDTSSYSVLAVTVLMVDKAMHGMQLGSLGLMDAVKRWVHEGHLGRILDRLFKAGFQVILTADHGNIEAEGIDAPKQGVLADTAGQRCRIYSESAFASSVLQEVPNSAAWKHPGLPEEFHVVLPPAGRSFAARNKRIVCHGGTSLEEVVVPFAMISPK